MWVIERISGGYSFWASGISLFRADVLIEEFHRLEPETFYAVSAAVSAGQQINGALHLEETAFVKARAEPTERLVFERSAAVALAPAREIQWDDVGAWNAVQKISTRNEHGNVINGDVLALDTHNSLIQSDSRLVAVIGLRDMIVVDTPDALLVMNRDHAQNVKQVVEHLKGLNRPEVDSHRLRDTNWGQIESLSKDESYDMRMLVVAPGASLRVNGTGHGPSLLTFLNGSGSYERDGQMIMVERGDSVTIPADVTLPLTNTGHKQLRAMQLLMTHDAASAGALASTATSAVKAVASLFAKPEPAEPLAGVVS